MEFDWLLGLLGDEGRGSLLSVRGRVFSGGTWTTGDAGRGRVPL